MWRNTALSPQPLIKMIMNNNYGQTHGHMIVFLLLANRLILAEQGRHTKKVSTVNYLLACHVASLEEIRY